MHIGHGIVWFHWHHPIGFHTLHIIGMHPVTDINLCVIGIRQVGHQISVTIQFIGNGIAHAVPADTDIPSVDSSIHAWGRIDRRSLGAASEKSVIPLVELPRRAYAWIQGSDSIIAVIRTTPAPVEMEEVVCIITVTHKSMWAALLSNVIPPWIIEGAMGIQLSFQHGSPLGIGIDDMNAAIVGDVWLLLQIHVVAIIEIGIQRDRHFLCGSRANLWTIIHIDSHAAMVHQGGDSVSFSIRIASRIHVLHVIPIIVRVPEIRKLHPIFRMALRRVGIRTWTSGRMFPIVHNLSHGRCNTSCQNMTISCVRVGRTKIVERHTLIPSCSEERTDAAPWFRLQSPAIQETIPFRTDCIISFQSAFRHVSDFFIVGFQPGKSVCWHLIGNKSTVSRIPQYRMHAIIGSNDNEAAVVAKHIKAQEWLLASEINQADFGRRVHVSVQKRLGCMSGGLNFNFFCEDRNRQDKEHGQQDKASFHLT